jgi:hypothetical protein
MPRGGLRELFPDPPPGELHPLDRQMMTFMALGIPDREMANMFVGPEGERLKVTTSQIRQWWEDVRADLNVNSRRRGVVVCVQRGLIAKPTSQDRLLERARTMTLRPSEKIVLEAIAAGATNGQADGIIRRKVADEALRPRPAKELLPKLVFRAGCRSTEHMLALLLWTDRITPRMD